MKTHTDNFNTFGSVQLAAKIMDGKQIAIMARYDDTSETAIMMPNENALKLAKWILEVANGTPRA